MQNLVLGLRRDRGALHTVLQRLVQRDVLAALRRLLRDARHLVQAELVALVAELVDRLAGPRLVARLQGPAGLGERLGELTLAGSAGRFAHVVEDDERNVLRMRGGAGGPELLVDGRET